MTPLLVDGPRDAAVTLLLAHGADPSREALRQTGTEGTVTKGAVNFAQICANLANTMDLHPLLLPTNLANFAQIRPNSHNFGQMCFFPHVLDLHPRLLHHRLLGSN